MDGDGVYVVTLTPVDTVLTLYVRAPDAESVEGTLDAVQGKAPVIGTKLLMARLRIGVSELLVPSVLQVACRTKPASGVVAETQTSFLSFSCSLYQWCLSLYFV